MLRVRSASFPADSEAVLAIWHEYVSSPSVSLDYQGYQSEFSDLPGKYGEPDGRLLLGAHDTLVFGCVGLRKITRSICEMKRLYVRPIARGTGLGRALVERLIEEAKAAGYREMRLDVLAEFTAARRLYASFGFRPAEPVACNPIPGTQFLGLQLN